MTTRDGVISAVTRYWDWRAPSYQRDMEEEGRDGWLRSYRHALAALQPGRGEPLDVLDVGTGTGFVALLLAELGHRVTGLDVSPGMLALARDEAERREVEVRLLSGTAEPLPPLGRLFDLVTCRNLLWTLPDPGAALAGWRAVTRPGGAVLISDGIWHTARQQWRLCRNGLRAPAGQRVAWRFLRDYAVVRWRLPYWRGLTASDAASLLIGAGFVTPQRFDGAGERPEAFLVGARRP
ncbi:MAG: class I SAM-dependent methyltransferase [Egibacteraceae bacterium]